MARPRTFEEAPALDAAMACFWRRGYEATSVRDLADGATLAPKEAIRRFIGEIVERSAADKDRRGCFLINSALEVAPHDPELGEEIAKRLGEVEDFFFRSIKAGQATGAIPRERNARDLARLLLGVLLGIRVLARSKPNRALLEGVARPALALLD